MRRKLAMVGAATGMLVGALAGAAPALGQGAVVSGGPYATVLLPAAACPGYSHAAANFPYGNYPATAKGASTYANCNC